MPSLAVLPLPDTLLHHLIPVRSSERIKSHCSEEAMGSGIHFVGLLGEVLYAQTNAIL